MNRILLVEDNEILANIVVHFLCSDDYMVTHVKSGCEALELIGNESFALVILDWMLPDKTGLEVCKSAREFGMSTPIMMMTARGEASDKANALDAGADDYMVKPIDRIEFSARIRALLRRNSGAYKKNKCGPFELDTSNLLIFTQNKEIGFLPKEYEIMALFLKNPNKYFSAEAILRKVWGLDTDTNLNTVRTHIREIRKKLREFELDEHLENMRGRGYRVKI